MAWGEGWGVCTASPSPQRLSAVFHRIVYESHLPGGSVGQLQVRLLPARLCLQEDAKRPDAGRNRNTCQGRVSIY